MLLNAPCRAASGKFAFGAALALVAAALVGSADRQAVAQVVYGAPGQNHAEGITVYGAGETIGKPDLVEISMRATANAELTADAIVKYRDAKRRILEGFDKLKLEKLKIEEVGVSLTNHTAQEAMQMAMRGMVDNNAAAKSKVEIASSLQLSVSGIRDQSIEQVMETVGKLLDAAKDSGAEIGPSAADVNMAYRYGRQADSALVRFVVVDLNDLREQAYRNAVADARARAERLAKLNGVRVGEVLGVQEVQVSGDDGGQTTTPWGQVAPSHNKLNEPRITSDTFAEIPFRVKLMVRFGIAPPEEKTAQK
ncbi:MAG TPA: SIMPL domain-containing protein [Pirellulales bacterium]|nr:SIMPL domain-containing protein [Pirellulales bacterium]